MPADPTQVCLEKAIEAEASNGMATALSQYRSGGALPAPKFPFPFRFPTHLSTIKVVEPSI